MQFTPEALRDEVTSLPGQTVRLFSRQFSGYLQISDSKFIHYYYVDSENDPKNDPLVFWANGGLGDVILPSIISC
jgi:cathepsin A (carboxypeptidase C)